MNEQLNTIDREQLFKLACAASDCFPPHRVDALLFNARAKGDDDGLLEHIAWLRRLQLIDKIAILDNEGPRVNSTVPYEANPGKTYYLNRLAGLGVPDDSIVLTEERKTGLHTGTECQDLLALVAKKGWESAAAISQPHQSLRMLLTYIKRMGESRIPLYCLVPLATYWNQKVPGSQGLEPKPRIEHCTNEFDRLLPYQRDGQIATFEEGLEYIRWREQQYRKYPTIADFYNSLNI